ncbi:MAG: deoxyribose-phosphate aldolase [Phototrophicales bacterium]|nr:MAG: deoxyribose-phosphate aldolase [Phototrophicales bacterium]
MLDAKTLAAMIDHTLLKPDATKSHIIKLCDEAKQYGFASVCVNGVYVPLAAQQLKGSAVKVCTVVGFPLGAMSTAAKVQEASIAIEQGAQEIDMVLHIGALKDEDISALSHDIASVVAECQLKGVLSKVILETSMLTDDEKVIACRVSKEAGADFVKTSTGFGGGGATVADVRLMRQTVGEEMGVKASGGVRTLADARAMIEAGATRIGASAGVAIMQELLGTPTSSTNDSY